MILPPRRRLVRLAAAALLASPVLLPAAAPAAAGGARRLCGRDDPGPRRVEPVQHGARRRVRGVPAHLQPAHRVRQGRPTRRQASPTAGSEPTDRVTFHIRDGMKWSDGTPATSKDVCFSWGLAIAAHQADESSHRRRLPRPGPAGRRRHQGRVPRRQHVHRLHRRTSRTASSRSTCRSSPSTSGARSTTRRSARTKFDAAARRHRAVHARGVEDRPVRPVRAQPELLGHAGLRRRGRPALLHRQRRHDGPGAQGRRARLRPRRERRPVQAARDRPGRSRPSTAAANGWTQLAFNTLRHGHRQDDPRRRAVDEGAARPGVPRRPRLCRRQASSSWSACSAASATSARRSCRRSWPTGTSSPTTPRTFDIELAKQKLDAAGLPARRDRQAPRQGGQADQPAHVHARTRTTTTPKSAQFVAGVVRPARHQRHPPEPRQRPPDRAHAAARRRRRATRPSTTSSCGAGAGSPTRTGCCRSSGATQIGNLVGQPVLQPRRTTRCTTSSSKRRPTRRARRSSRRCRT